MFNELVPIERKSGVTLYGRVIDKNGRLGQFQVYSDRRGGERNSYATYKEAETRMNALIGVKSSNQSETVKTK